MSTSGNQIIIVIISDFSTKLDSFRFLNVRLLFLILGHHKLNIVVFWTHSCGREVRQTDTYSNPLSFCIVSAVWTHVGKSKSDLQQFMLHYTKSYLCIYLLWCHKEEMKK